jgi:hypothetical protein
MKYCGHCKKQTAESAKFCDECGNPLEDRPPVVHAPSQSQTRATVTTKQPGLPDDIGLRVLAVAAGCFGLWFLGLGPFGGRSTLQDYQDMHKIWSGDLPSILKYTLYALPALCFWFGFRSRPRV